MCEGNVCTGFGGPTPTPAPRFLSLWREFRRSWHFWRRPCEKCRRPLPWRWDPRFFPQYHRGCEQLVLPRVQQSFPTIEARDVIYSQPMTGPTSLPFFLEMDGGTKGATRTYPKRIERGGKTYLSYPLSHYNDGPFCQCATRGGVLYTNPAICCQCGLKVQSCDCEECEKK